MIQLRPYQSAAIDAIYGYFGREAGNPLIVLPTGTGKGLVLASFAARAIADWPDTRILIVTHVKELIAQNFAEMMRLWPEAPAGVYSAGLNKRDLHAQILFAGIQSVHKRAYDIQRCDLALIDEAHLIGRTSNTMYRRFLGDLSIINPHLKVIGVTATPYRLDSGMLHEGDGALFTDIAYEAGIAEMIAQGYLCEVVPKRTQTRLDTTGVGSRGGEFIAGQLETAVDVAEVTASAVDEIVRHGAERGSWLVFCAGVRHAEHVRDAIKDRGFACAAILGETASTERDRMIAAYQRGEIRCLTNANVLTTGFNAPGVDLIAMLRPTKSVGLYVQMIGRGTRLANGKENCIAEGQRVLTNEGLVPIERVTTAMKVWDGAEFVRHGGAIFRGEREVISYEGLEATPDHLVWTQKGWTTLGQCAAEQASVAVTGDGGRPVRTIEGRFRGDRSEKPRREAAPIDRMPGLWGAILERLHQLDERLRRVPRVRQPAQRAEMVGDACHIRKATVHKPERPFLRSLWGARNPLRVSIANGHGGMGSGESRAAQGPGARPDRQRRALRAGQLALPEPQAEPMQQARATPYHEDAQVQGDISGASLLRQHASPYVLNRSDHRSDCGAICTKVRKTKRRVWDILNAGQRHCFTVEGILVHNCLVLDFAGNVERHGPIDCIDGRRRKKDDEDGAAPVKGCPACQTIVHAATRQCPVCGYEFPPPKPDLAHTASTSAILSSQIQPEWVTVSGISYHRHEKSGSPPSLRVEYHCGLASHREWVCFEHTGYARQKAVQWWQKRLPDRKAPSTVAEALAASTQLPAPARISVRPQGRYTDIIGYEFAPCSATSAAARPAALAGSMPDGPSTIGETTAGFATSAPSPARTTAIGDGA